jgi:predicted permease
MQDLKWALRSLRKSPGFTLLSLFTLTLGIGATMAAFAVLDAVILRELPYRDAGRLVFIQERTAKAELRPPSHLNFRDWRSRATSFDGVAAAQYPELATVRVAPDAEPQRVANMGVSQRFFGVLGAPLAVGREFTPEEESTSGVTVAMVSYEFWQSQMGGRLPLGDLFFGDTRRAIVGVTPPGFQFVTRGDVFFPYEPWAGTVRSAHNYMVIGRLKPSTTIDATRAEMTTLSRALKATFGDETEAVDVDVRPLRDFLIGNYRGTLGVVFGAALCVLLITCTNLLSAQLARGWVREREIVVRSALGASRTRLVRQLCTESLVLVLVGAVFGAVLSAALVKAVKVFGEGLLPRLSEISIDGRLLMFVLASVLLTTMLVGVYPALRLSRSDSRSVLRSSRGTGGLIRASFWRALIAFEIALAVVLVVGSALLVRTMQQILNADSGFDTRGLVTAAVGMGEHDVAHIAEIEQSLATLPGAREAAFTNRLPLSWGNGAGPVRRPSDPLTHDWPALAGYRVVTPNYFSVLRQPILAGRSFTTADREGTAAVAIVTVALAAKLWPGESAVGKTVATNYLWGKWLTVVGVVPEASSWSMARGAQHEIFVPLAQQNASTQGQLIAVVRVTNAPKVMMPAIRAKLRELLPQSAAQVSTIDDRIARSAADRRFAMFALVAFGSLALFLAAVGIYGVLAYSVASRQFEIGVRMALGATSESILRRILGSAAAMTATGVVFGGMSAVVTSQYLKSLLYGVTPYEPSAYAVGALLLFAVALLGAYIPARRASRVDPTRAMRAES